MADMAGKLSNGVAIGHFCKTQSGINNKNLTLRGDNILIRVSQNQRRINSIALLISKISI